MRQVGNQKNRWITNWAWGNCSASEVVRSAQAYVEDHGTRGIDNDVLRLSKTSTNMQNAERVLESILPSDGLIAPVDVPDSSISLVLPPYDLFHWLRTKNAHRFEVHMGGKPGGVQSFWESFKSSAAGKRMWRLHPWLRGREPSDLRWHLPLMLFDDAGPVSNISSTFVRCWYSVLGIGSDRETRYLCATGLKEGNATEDKSWSVIMSQFEQLAQPAAAGSWGGILLFIGADMEYMCNMLGMPHFNANDVCGFCRANDSDIPHNDFSAEALWRATMKDNVRCMADFRMPLHPLVAHPWFSMHSYRFDLLHMMDHHGVTSHIVANILWQHVGGDRQCDALPGSNVQERLDFLNAEIKQFYSAEGVVNRLPPLGEGNLKGTDGFPDFHGNGVKAANTRSIVPYVLALQKRATAMVYSRSHRHMLKIVESLDGIYRIFYDGPCFLDASDLAKLREHLERLARHYQHMQVQSFAEGKLRWKSTIKLHYVAAHLHAQAQLINPRFVQGYSSESLVGTICGIYSKSQSGPFHRTIQRVSLLKYRTGLKLLWE